MKNCNGAEAYIHTFVTSILHEREQLASRSGRFTIEKNRPITYEVRWNPARSGRGGEEKNVFSCRQTEGWPSSPQSQSQCCGQADCPAHSPLVSCLPAAQSQYFTQPGCQVCNLVTMSHIVWLLRLQPSHDISHSLAVAQSRYFTQSGCCLVTIFHIVWLLRLQPSHDISHSLAVAQSRYFTQSGC